jgi:hypothetical protein
VFAFAASGFFRIQRGFLAFVHSANVNGLRRFIHKDFLAASVPNMK